MIWVATNIEYTIYSSEQFIAWKCQVNWFCMLRYCKNPFLEYHSIAFHLWSMKNGCEFVWSQHLRSVFEETGCTKTTEFCFCYSFSVCQIFKLNWLFGDNLNFIYVAFCWSDTRQKIHSWPITMMVREVLILNYRSASVFAILLFILHIMCNFFYLKCPLLPFDCNCHNSQNTILEITLP